MPEFNSRTPLTAIWEEGVRKLGSVDALDLPRELVERVECAKCGYKQEILQPAERIHSKLLSCPRCQIEAAPVFFHTIQRGSPFLEKSVGEIGLPGWDIVWARSGLRSIGFEIAGDSPFVETAAETRRKGEDGLGE